MQNQGELRLGFSNEIKTDDELPAVGDLAFRSLEPSYALMRQRVICSVVALFALMAVLAVLFQRQLPLALWGPVSVAFSVLTMAGLLMAVYRRLADPRKAYALRDHDLSFRSGVWFVSVVTQPIARIQHVELTQGPLERRYDLANVLAFSAGGQQHTFAIPGLKRSEAERLRQFILQHRDARDDES